MSVLQKNAWFLPSKYMDFFLMEAFIFMPTLIYGYHWLTHLWAPQRQFDFEYPSKRPGKRPVKMKTWLNDSNDKSFGKNCQNLLLWGYKLIDKSSSKWFSIFSNYQKLLGIWKPILIKWDILSFEPLFWTRFLLSENEEFHVKIVCPQIIWNGPFHNWFDTRCGSNAT